MARVGRCRLSQEGVTAVQKRYREGHWVNIAAFCNHLGIPRSTYYELIGRNVWFEQATIEDKLNLLGVPQDDYDRLYEFKEPEWQALQRKTGPHEQVCAFLFTEIEGSVRLWDAAPEAMRVALARHDSLLHRAIESHQGVVFKTMGDAFCSVFPTSSQALLAALAAQQALHAQLWPPETPLRVRMALHTGIVEERNGDYFGHTVSRISRLLATGHGGQILLTQVVCDAAQESLPNDVSLRDMLSHRLRDIQQPEHIWQLLHPSLPADFPPLRSLQAFANNLPVQPTSFIGRQQEIAQVKSLLEQTRLLTLTGIGGCGKTRLSLEVAADLLEAYPDGVWQIELGALTDGAFIPQTLVTVLGLREQPGQALLQTLIEALQTKTTLLLLDNCEHLLGACASLADSLLRSCPHLKLLATSREALSIAGETIWRVPSLVQPDAGGLDFEQDTASELICFDAVRLFVERARSQRSDFLLTHQNGPVVVEICRRLDGIPLAIELAAARVRTLTPEHLCERLDQRFHLLTGGSRTALPRQQTLRALVDWSYDLLSAQERLLFGRMSVFAGGWTLEAAEAVCADTVSLAASFAHASEVGTRLTDWEMLDLLSSLVDKSLVAFEERSGVGRYRLLETLRQYAQERLMETEKREVWRDRHRDYFLALAEEAEPHLTGVEQVQWLAQLEGEYDNLREALAWCKAEENGAESGLRLAGALCRFWQVRGHFRDGREYLAKALESESVQGRTQTRAKALNGASNLARIQGDYGSARALSEQSLAISRELADMQGIAQSLNNLANVALAQADYSEARTLYEQSLAMSRELADKQGIAASLNNLGIAAWNQGDYGEATALYEQSLAIRRELGDKQGIAASLQNLGVVAWNQGDYGAARELYEQSLTTDRELGNKQGIANSLHNLGNVAYEQGDYSTARVLGEQSLAMSRELADKRGAALSLLSLGNVAYMQGDYGRAGALFEQSLAIHRELGDKQGIASLLNNLGTVAYNQGDYDTARMLQVESLTIRRELGDKLSIAISLASFADLMQEAGYPVRAALLWGAAEALREEIGSPRPLNEREEYDRRVTAVRALDEAAFDSAWAEGHVMSLEQAITNALLCALKQTESA